MARNIHMNQQCCVNTDYRVRQPCWMIMSKTTWVSTVIVSMVYPINQSTCISPGYFSTTALSSYLHYRLKHCYIQLGSSLGYAWIWSRLIVFSIWRVVGSALQMCVISRCVFLCIRQVLIGWWDVYMSTSSSWLIGHLPWSSQSWVLLIEVIIFITQNVTRVY